MNKTTAWTLIIIIVLIIVGVIWWSNQSANQTPATSTSDNNSGLYTSSSEIPTPTATPLLATASSSTLGTFLTDLNGKTLYHFTKDSVGTSTCYSQCASLWLPYIIPSSLTNITGGSMATGVVATITRTDNSAQVTYNGLPLYYWHNDVNPGDTLGQGIGNVWYVVAP